MPQSRFQPEEILDFLRGVVPETRLVRPVIIRAELLHTWKTGASPWSDSRDTSEGELDVVLSGVSQSFCCY